MGESRPILREAIPAPVSRAGQIAAGLVWVYQKTVSPALAVISPSCGCRFVPTCSHYASAALREHGLLAGLGLTVRRLVKCGPWHPGGLDPVPSRPAPVCFRVAVAASPSRESRRNFHG